MEHKHDLPLSKTHGVADTDDCSICQQHRPTLSTCYGTIPPRGQSANYQWQIDDFGLLQKYWGEGSFLYMNTPLFWVGVFLLTQGTLQNTMCGLRKFLPNIVEFPYKLGTYKHGTCFPGNMLMDLTAIMFPIILK